MGCLYLVSIDRMVFTNCVVWCSAVWCSCPTEKKYGSADEKARQAAGRQTGREEGRQASGDQTPEEIQKNTKTTTKHNISYNNNNK